MRIFEHPNCSNGWKCPICLESTDLPIVLIGIIGTEEGTIMQAEQIHVDCLDLKLFLNERIIAQRLP